MKSGKLMVFDEILNACLSPQNVWARDAIGLFLAPFVHENVAIVGGAALIVGHRLPIWLAISSLYFGMTASDLGLYWVGTAARRNSSARKLFMSEKIYRLSSLMQGYMGTIIVISRLIPGMIFPSYVACGWLGLPFRRFAILSMASAAIYLPIALALAVGFGRVTADRFGDWAWIGLIVPLLAAGILAGRLMVKR